MHIGPGVYRERVIPLNDGFSDACKIYYVGDDTCQHNINDAKGRIRITGCTAAELTTVGAVLDWTGKLFVELHNVYVDGSSNTYQCVNILCRKVHASGLYGFSNSVNSNLYNCSALSGVYGFTTAGGIVNYFSCKSLAGKYGFYVSGGTANHYSCVSVSGSAGFSGGRQFNCTAIGSSSAFNLSEAYNCLGIVQWALQIPPSTT